MFGGIDVKIYTFNDVQMFGTKNISARGSDQLFVKVILCRFV